MQRLLFEKLEEWRTSVDRKPLVLRGARQVGKTWLLQEFGKQKYECFWQALFFGSGRVIFSGLAASLC